MFGSAVEAGGTAGDSHCETAPGHWFSTKHTEKVIGFFYIDLLPRTGHRVTTQMFTLAISGGSAGLH